MSRLTDIIDRINDLDRDLGSEIKNEINSLLLGRSFGLVFERHFPESVELPLARISKGDKVHILAKRGWKLDEQILH